MNQKIFTFFLVLFFITGCSDLEKIETKEDGVLIESYTQKKSDGKKHGTFISYFPSGEKNEETQYDNGKINGTQFFYHKNGKISESVNYVDGTHEGAFKKYFESGELEQEGNFSDGAMNGELKVYYPNGKLKEVVILKNNDEFGPFKEYHENGNLKTEGTYSGVDPDTSNALEDGELKKYDEQGVHYQTMNCSKGLCMTTWKKEGVVIEE